MFVDKTGPVEAASVPIVRGYFEDRGWTVSPITGRLNQKRYGDLQIVKGKKLLTIECKADQYNGQSNSGAIFAEWQIDALGNECGWLIDCEADWMAYHLTRQGWLYFFRASDLKNLIFKEIGVENFTIRTQRKNQSYNSNQVTIGIVVTRIQLKKLPAFKAVQLPTMAEIKVA